MRLPGPKGPKNWQNLHRDESGDGMEFSALVTLFDEKGNQLDPKEGIPFKGNGVRIPLEILPSSAHHLPIPQ
jgi:hypothetical protein